MPLLPTIFTIGHSTHPIAEFIGMLEANAITLLVDIRTIPKSRHNPQFNCDELARTLPAAGIEYTHLPGLGGLRHARRDSFNTAWKNASFRSFADHMQTPEFVASLDELIRLATPRPTAIMCAEAVPWRCHRSLVADALTARSIPVEDIQGRTRTAPHRMTPFALVEGTTVTYPMTKTHQLDFP
jgi:uncharacterized protein (DUF488 family)